MYLKDNWPAILLFISVISGAIASYKLGQQDSAQKKRIEDSVNFTKKLTAKINDLQQLDTSLSHKIDKIVSESKVLTEKNLDVTTKANELITKVESLTSATHILTSNLNKKTDNEIAKNTLIGEIDLTTDESLSPDDLVTFVLGGTNFSNPVYAWNSGASLGFFSGYEPIKFRIKNNKVLLSFTCYDRIGNYIGEIEENNWRRNPNYTSKFNYDKKGVEIIDNQNEVAFSIDILDSHRILLQGVIGDKQSNMVIIIGMNLMAPKPKGYPYLQEQIDKAGFKQLFEYTGSDYLHKRKRY